MLLRRVGWSRHVSKQLRMHLLLLWTPDIELRMRAHPLPRDIARESLAGANPRCEMLIGQTWV